MDYDVLYNNIELLNKYTELTNDEWSETVIALCILAGRIDYISEELAAALEHEIAAEVEYVKEHANIVTRKETYTRTIYEVEWKDE